MIPELIPKEPPKVLVETLSCETGSKPEPKFKFPLVEPFKLGKKFPFAPLNSLG